MIMERLGAGVRKGTQCPFSQKGPSSVLIHVKTIIAAVILRPGAGAGSLETPKF